MTTNKLRWNGVGYAVWSFGPAGKGAWNKISTDAELILFHPPFPGSNAYILVQSNHSVLEKQDLIPGRISIVSAKKSVCFNTLTQV